MINLAGHDIGRYHITESLGEGSMAVVYKALDTHLERDVAVKVIRSDQIPPAQLTNMLARFEREAKALARLEHANIIRIFDYGEYQGAPYLVMNYLPGGALKKYMGRPLAYRSAARFLLPMARALEYAHQQGVVHGGVKPANILLTQQKAPILSDFGIVRILENEGGTLTGTGVGVGTPGYMAPEQWSGKIDPAVDIYALGVVLYELITGRMPYQANTPMEIFSKQLTEPLPQLSRFIADLPSDVEQIITRALDVKPAERYGSMSEMIGKLEQVQSLSAPAAAAPKAQANIPARQAKPEENQLTVTLDEGVSFDFVRIPAGSFFMGEDDPLKSQYNRPSCQIFLNEFWMGKYPITNAQYRMFTREVNDKKPIGGFPADKEDHPVININWSEAMAFCEWLNKKINSRVPKGFVVRLPTEAEWEKAGRGTDKRIYPWGNDVPDTRLCNFSDNKIKGTTPVGHYSPQGDSPYGCVDMIGNVWEWTHSQRSSYPYRRYDGREDENKNNHVIRGGSFRCELRSLACNLGFTQEYDGREIDQGFRISIAPLLNGIEEMELAHREQEAEKQVKQERIKKAEQARRQTEDKARSEGNLMSLLLSENVPMVFVRVPAGKFLIGRNNSEEKNLSTNSQISQNEVYLDEYWIGKYPVTNAQWRVYVQSVKEKVTIPWENGMIPDGMENDPVWLYSNYDVVGFCDWVSKKTGKKIRLPSETEWEKAARGTDGRIYPWGNDVPNEQYLNFQQNIGTTTPVGLFSPLGDSPYGCADMAGNLRQIVNDWNSEDYYGVTPKLSPTGPSRGDQWVVRGSIFWENDPQITRRFSFDPECGYFSFGFRCAYSIPISVIQLEEDVFMEFVKISGGKFLMGSKEPDNMAGKEEKPQHQVYLDEYWMGRYEVTNRQWEVFVRLNKKKAPVHWINGTIPKGKENHPVVNVSWYDVVAFCDWISEKTGKKISLPSEAEWEMAARGTDGRIYPWGNDHLNLWNGYQTDLESISVGQFSPDSDSPYGCSDMVGNIWEWTGDWYGQYTEAAVENPTGPINGKVRVLRGGSWGDCGVNGLRVTLREGGSPEVGHKKIGFRCKMPEVNPSSNRKKKQEKTENYFSILLSEDVLIEFVRVPSGKFFMGRKRVRSEFYETNEDSSPQHEVFLDEYWMGKFPVTNAQYRIFVEETNHSQPEEGIPGGKDDHPVVGISWNDATAFCEWISKKTGRKIRLPTEAEWEKAARGTDGRIRPWGEDTPEEWRKRYFARSYFSNKQRSLPVGRYSPEADSPYGCADMAGWLREWVFDWYDENYYSYSPNRNPSGPMRGKEKSQRGGGWFDDIDNKSSFIMNVADRFSCDPASPNERTGFRCVATSETLK